jgi:hypothetical protein
VGDFNAGDTDDLFFRRTDGATSGITFTGGIGLQWTAQ